MVLKRKKQLRIPVLIFLILFLVGCASIPKDFLKLPEDSLQSRQQQTKEYDTTNEEEVIAACAGVLQDLGFMIDNSESELGLVVGSKERDATDTGQVAAATILTILDALAGTSSRAFEKIDKVQKIRASVVTGLTKNDTRIVVRVTFQRVVWNARGAVSRMETLKDPELYQGFFERLSKSIFLEAHKI